MEARQILVLAESTTKRFLKEIGKRRLIIRKRRTKKSEDIY